MIQLSLPSVPNVAAIAARAAYGQVKYPGPDRKVMSLEEHFADFCEDCNEDAYGNRACDSAFVRASDDEAEAFFADDDPTWFEVMGLQHLAADFEVAAARARSARTAARRAEILGGRA